MNETVAEQELMNESAKVVMYQPNSYTAQSLPMSCSDSLISNSEISTSSCNEKAGTCVDGPLQSLMDGKYDHAWRPSSDIKSEFIMYNWTEPMMIHYIQTAGYADTGGPFGGAVQDYKLEYGTANGDWEYYVDHAENGGKSWTILDGYAEAPDAKMNALNPPIETRYLRIRPQTWKGRIAMRASVRGCPASTVKAGDMELNADYRSIFPAKFPNLQAFVTELRLQVSEATGSSIDQVQVESVKEKAGDMTKTVARVEILPKNGMQPPADLLQNLQFEISDPTSKLFKWTQSLQKRDDLEQYSCENIDCHAPNGECAGGQCFCFEGWEGPTCEEDKNAAHQNVKVGDTTAGTSVNDLKPLPVLTGVPKYSLKDHEIEPYLSMSELDAEIDQIAEDERDSNLYDEGGWSGMTKQHSILVGVGMFVMVAGWIIAIFFTNDKRKRDKLVLDEDLPRASLQD
jgi:hypothetical protein